ncbi:neuronal acetylcholine receptor subunit alpha-3 [Elysia marginata]|uniref:Neuronal acetylcholine receptor subunit alpha-3 n=1 Tax=Elysia marginata TaxID=1093978 RepID=A0AAV4GP00_9GAST|nr:neuronal acetylcholine receptor subunit alpha-3 [Elysia marginata]
MLNLRAFLKISWRDETLFWRPEQYGNVTFVLLSQDALWLPDIALTNSLADNIFPGGNGAKVKLSFDGRVDWVPAFNSEFSCQVNVVKFPMDVDTCVIKLGSWMYDDSLVHVEPMTGYTHLNPDVTNGQFYLEIGEPKEAFENYDGILHSTLHFVIKLERMPGFAMLSFLLPMFVIGLLNILSFVIPADNEGKVDLSLNIMLSTTMFLSIIHDDLPDRSDKIASIAVYVITLFVMSFLGVVGNIVVLLVHKGEQEREHSSGVSKSPSRAPSDTLEAKHFTVRFRHSLRRQRPEMDSCPTAMSLDQSQTDDKAHDVRIVSGSKAAKINFVFLVVSAIGLFVVSLATLVLIFS